MSQKPVKSSRQFHNILLIARATRLTRRVDGSTGRRWDTGAAFRSGGAKPRARPRRAVGHTGDRTNSFDANAGYPNLHQPAYTLVDFNMGTSLGGFDLGFYVRNLTDERAQLGLYAPFIQVGGPGQVTYARPRTIDRRPPLVLVE